MATAYDYLLEAAISHLEDLKHKGVNHVKIDPGLLSQLSRPAPVRIPFDPRAATEREPAPAGIATKPLKASPTIAAASVDRPPGGDSVASDLIMDPSVPLSPERKEAEMARIRERAVNCVKCPNLADSRRHVVFGVGDIHTDLLFVGEAPGLDEDEQGEPFVGAAGQLLTRIIKAMDRDRDNVYIANVLKCRPDTPGRRTGNRKPTLAEMNTCKPYLLAQISVIRPKVIVALGATAVEGLLGKPTGIMKLRGNWQDFHGTPLMPTFHPAYLLRNESLTEKRKVWEDMLAVMEKLNMPISDKQRRFFLAR